MILFDKGKIEKSIVIKSSREVIMQFGKAEMPIDRKGTLIVEAFLVFNYLTI